MATGEQRDILEGAWEVQHRLEERAKHFGKGKYGRVLRMARKPDSDEYLRIIQIVGIGLALIGGLGFLIYWLFEYGAPYFAGLFG